MLAILYPEQFRRLFGELNYRNPVALLAIAAPTISATILTAAWQGKTGLRELYARLVQWRFGIKWYALILLGIPFLGWLTTLVAGANPVYVLSTPAFAISILLNLMYTGPLCEELGWRGYALPRLLRQFNPLVASLILGLFWGVWHLPSFFISSVVQSSLSLPAFLLFGLFTSILMTWIFQTHRWERPRRSPVPLYGERVAFNHWRTVGRIRIGVDGVCRFGGGVGQKTWLVH